MPGLVYNSCPDVEGHAANVDAYLAHLRRLMLAHGWRASGFRHVEPDGYTEDEYGNRWVKHVAARGQTVTLHIDVPRGVRS